MGVRTKIGYNIEVGPENSLDSFLFQRAIEERLDTMDKESSHSGELAAAEANTVLDKGDITEIRFLYLEADGDLDVFLDGVAATTATVTGVGGAFPTGFVGAETLSLEIDAVAFVTTFDDADEALSAVVNRINAAAAFAGLNGLVASDSAGQLKLTSLTSGVVSEVKVTAASAGVAAILGLTVPTTVNGLDPTPAQSPMSLRQMGDATNESAVAGLKAYLLVTVVTDKVTVTNPSATEAVRYRVLMLGDLVDPATIDC